MALRESVVVSIRRFTIPLTTPDFRWFWLGDGISVLGNQFFIVALPWTVLKITGSGVALGTVLMFFGIPRLTFMLIGGALSDLFSRRTLLIVSNIIYTILALVLATLVAANALQLWMLFVLAFGFGTVDSFFYPALNAIIPQIVDKDQIPTANAWQQGTGLVAQSIGPGLAGFTIALIHEAGAFGVDALSFIFATVTLFWIQINKPPASSENSLESKRNFQSVLADIRIGIRYVRSQNTLRTLLIITGIANFFFMGAMFVGPAKLAADRFPEGVTALGILSSGLGIGSLIGVILAALIRPRDMVVVILSLYGVSGFLLIGIGFSQSVWMATSLLLVVGLITGFINLIFISWIQKTVAHELLGRVMSLVILASTGSWPVASALGGIVVQINISLMFTIAGLGVALVGLIPLFNRNIRSLAN